MPQKHVLILTGAPIHPAMTGGSVHTICIARALTGMGHRVTMYAFAGREDLYRQSRKDIRQDLGAGLVQYVHMGLLHGLLQAAFRRLGAPRVWQHWLLRHGWVPASLRQLATEADVVMGDMPHSAPWPGAVEKKPWLMISHDLAWKQISQKSAKRERLWTNWMQRVEAAAPRLYDDILTIAEEDHDYFQAHMGSRPLLLPTVGCGVNPADYATMPQQRVALRAELGVADDERLIVFSGSRFGPNEEALRGITEYAESRATWLAEHKLRFLIVGSIVATPYRKGQLIATGRVPEIAPYLAAADAGINPIISGTGANVKLFEYLAVRLPVISTVFGVRGTSLVPHVDYLPCEHADYDQALQRLCSQSPADWHAHAEAVWQRHKHYCDIREQVREAMATIPRVAAALA